MTEATSQNNNIDSMLLNMLNNDATSSAPKLKSIKGGQFSNIVNTITSNVEKTQSRFVEQAIKSNTSSINRFMLQDLRSFNPAKSQTDFLKKDIASDFRKLSFDEENPKEDKKDSDSNDKDITLDSSAHAIGASLMPSPSFCSSDVADDFSIPLACVDLFEGEEINILNTSSNKTQEPTEIPNGSLSGFDIDIENFKADENRFISAAQEFEFMAKNEAIDGEIDILNSKISSVTGLDLKGFEAVDTPEEFTEFKLDTQNNKISSALSNNALNDASEDSSFDDFLQNKNQGQNNNESNSFNKNFGAISGKETKEQAPKGIEDMKFDFVNRMKESLDAEIKLSSFSSEIDNSYTLSASDDVAKMSLTNDASFKMGSTPNNTLNYGNETFINISNLNFKANPVNQNVFETNDILSQIGSKIENLKTQQGQISGQKLTLVLRPHDLGRVSIQLTQDSAGLTTNILAQNDEVRTYLEKNIHILKQQLQDSGINVNSIQIKTQGQDGFSSYDGNKNLENDDFNNQNDKENHHENQRENKKEQQQMLFGLADYDTGFQKDFSQILNRTTNYEI